jgi:hypothetical protein
MGVLVIASSGTIGLLWRYLRPRWRKKNPVLELLGMGLAVHICMLLCTFFLPHEVRNGTIITIAFPVLVLYPGATLLLGLLMLHQSQNSENKKALDKVNNVGILPLKAPAMDFGTGIRKQMKCFIPNNGKNAWIQ